MKYACAMSAVALVAMLGHGAAQAQSAGNLLISVGGNNIDPKVHSGDLSASSLPGTKIDVKDASAPIAIFSYMLTDAISLQTFIGLPYKHEIIGAGAIAGAGKIGSVKQLSPTLIAQYRFLAPTSAFRPYVGLGLTYTYFFKEEGSATLTGLTNPGGRPTEMKVDNAWGTTTQIGATYAFNERWFADFSVIKTFISNTTHLSTGQSIDARLDPIILGLTVGYKF